MSDKHKNITVLALTALLLLGFSIWSWTKPPQKTSESERRLLAQFPEPKIERILSGAWAKDFESYATDQFPMRESFRATKAFAAFHLMRLKDNNKIYRAGDHLSKIEYPMNEEMLEYAADLFRSIYEKHLGDSKVYFSIIPDKHYYLSGRNGYLAMDYDRLIETMRGATEYMRYIDLKDALSIDRFYHTDAHWKQETLIPIAKLLGEAMGFDVQENYSVRTLEMPLKGVYVGQYALPIRPDVLHYLVHEEFDALKITNFDSGTPVEIGVYDLERAKGLNAYDLFLSRASSLIEIENPNAKSDRELILFRDSFGSSIAPLLTSGYRKITLVDLRYLPSKFLDRFIDFSGQDVLFLYSTTLLNNSKILR